MLLIRLEHANDDGEKTALLGSARVTNVLTGTETIGDFDVEVFGPARRDGSQSLVGQASFSAPRKGGRLQAWLTATRAILMALRAPEPRERDDVALDLQQGKVAFHRGLEEPDPTRAPVAALHAYRAERALSEKQARITALEGAIRAYINDPDEDRQGTLDTLAALVGAAKDQPPP